MEAVQSGIVLRGEIERDKKDLLLNHPKSDIRDHALGMIVDSQGFLAFMVNRGKAADALNLAPGDPVVIESD